MHKNFIKAKNTKDTQETGKGVTSETDTNGGQES